MKRVIAIFMAIMMITLVACGNETEKKDETQKAAEGKKTTQEEVSNEAEETASKLIRDSYSDLENADVMILKMTGIRQYQLFYEGFNQMYEVLPGVHKTADLSPAEANITAQVKAIDEAIASKVECMAVGPTGSTGYDEVLKKAQNAGIGIFSIDAAVSPEYRIAHVNQADALEVGAYCVASAIMISQGVEYDSTAGTTVLEQCEELMKNYTGDPITIGILSTTVDAPVQNSWIEGIDKEIAKEVYGGKITTQIKYTNDDLQNAAVQISAFVTENEVDSFLSLTANASVVVGQVLSESDTELKATGIGMPSQQAAYMPTGPEDNPFDYPMPWVIMWDPINVGRVLATTMEAWKNGEYDGSIGSTLTVPASGEYPEETYTTTTHPDGGAEIIAGAPTIFDKYNISDWKDKF